MLATLDLIVRLILWAVFGALIVYKCALLFQYRHDAAKREALLSSGQVFPARLAKFIHGEFYGTRRKM